MRYETNPIIDPKRQNKPNKERAYSPFLLFGSAVWGFLLGVLMLNGWVKNHRKTIEWEWFKKPFMYRIFSYLVLLANHEDGKWQGVEIKKGQIITGLHSIKRDTGISIQSIRTCLARLESSGEIIVKSTNKFSIITICNYCKYQQDQQTNQQTINKQSTNNQQQTRIKEEEEVKEYIVVKPSRQQIPYAEIISYLNEKTGSSFKNSTAATRGCIKARWAEGFRLDHFKAVIDNKVDEWKTDSKMCIFLRPITLFGTKFESYLQNCGIQENKPSLKWVKNARTTTNDTDISQTGTDYRP